MEKIKPAIVKDGEEGYIVFYKNKEKHFKYLEEARKYKHELEINY